MKAFRLRAAVAVIVLIVVVAAVVLSNSSFQTWAVRRALAGNPSLSATVGHVSAGFGQVELREVRMERDGVVLAAPKIEAEGSVFAAVFRKQLKLTRLAAQGWTVDLSQAKPRVAMVPASAASSAPANDSAAQTKPVGGPVAALNSTAGNSPSGAEGFAGIFAQLQLPVDLTLEQVDFQGQVVLPEKRGRVQVAVRGGGLVSGREGKLDLTAKADLSTTDVSAVSVQGSVRAEMNSPRTFAHLSARIDTSAVGALFPQGVTLTTQLAATRKAGGEKYEATVVAKDRNVLRFEGELPKAAALVTGIWKLDVRSADAAPFVFGKPLPEFTAVGEGHFETDARFAGVRLIGRLNGDVARLGVLAAQLSAVAPLKVAADFDVACRGATFAVEKFTADLANPADAQPVARFAAQQVFEFNPASAEVRAAAPDQDLLAVALHRVPVSWLQPLLPSLAVQGGAVRGEFTLSPRGGGAALRSRTPLVVDALTVGHDGKLIVQQLDVSLRASADYTPQGWQAEVSEFTAKNGPTPVLILDAKAGQLAGKDQALKLAGKLTVELPALLDQPFLASELPLAKGEASVEFAASLAAKQELQAKFVLKNLAGDPALKIAPLPTLVADLRLDRDAAGAIAFNAPVVLERDGQKTDLALAGSIKPAKALQAIDARLTSTDCFVEQLQVLASLWTSGPLSAASETAKPTAPPWAGLTGAVALEFNHVVYPGGFEASNVTGTLRLENGTAKLETVRAGVGEGSELKLSGAVTFDATATQPYALAAELAVNDFDPADMFRTRAPQQSPTIEGKLNIATTLAAQASTLHGLQEASLGDVVIASRGGVFRGLPVNVSNLTETTSRLASWLASAGNAIGLTGKREQDEITNKTQAATEVSKALGAIAYDQLRVVFTRDVARQFAVKELTLISPELRLTGSGRAMLNDATPWLERPLAMEYQLRARGRQADLLKFLGVLEPGTDDLGYALCTLPLRINGSPVKPDATEVSQKFVTVALEKNGLSERAAELLNRLRGYGK